MNEFLTDAERISDEAFKAWRDSLPQTHWARYDLSACRLGWDARETEIKTLREQCERMRIAMERIREEGDDHSDTIAWECLSGSSPDAPVNAEPNGDRPA